MRYKPEQKQQTAANILAAAERGFRLGGYGGIGVDGLAQEAGVTSGAFYKHYSSKAAVFEAAVNAGMQKFESNIEGIQASHGDGWLKAVADYYLSREHRENIAEGCVVPGLSGEVSRSTDQVRNDYQDGLKRIAERVAAGLTDADDDSKSHAWAILAMLAGGVLMSRAVQDEKLADEISKAVHDTVFSIVK